MLIEFKVKIQLSVIGFLNLHCHRFEQFVDVILDKQRMSKDAHDLHNWAANLMVMFDDTHEAICDDGHMYLNTDSILAFTPEGFDLEMLLDPFEEQFNLPSVFIKECYFTCFKIEIIKYIIDVTDAEKLPEHDAPVVIEDDVWCGANVTILKGVTIGHGSVVAAGAVVTKSCPPYSIIGGVSAKIIKKRFTPEQIKEHELKLYNNMNNNELNVMCVGGFSFVVINSYHMAA